MLIARITGGGMTEKKKSAGREEILRVAARQFSVRGYAGTTTAGVAREAGVTQPLIHHHFGSKEGLWGAVLEDLFTQLDTVLAEAWGKLEDASLEERSRKMLKAFLSYNATRPELSRLITLATNEGEEGFVVMYERWLHNTMEGLRVVFAELSQAGLIDLQEGEEWMFHMMITGASIRPFLEQKALNKTFGVDVMDPKEMDRYADFLLRQLLRRPQ
ncbi:MAG: TetR/AcrR family transcriptional regulator [Myxococcales bacterium]|nr:TetR/AcrR family transcriptional regulator [Myxococcales bacterium]